MPLVSACGGSSGVTGGGTYSDREADALSLYSELETLGFSDPASLPFTPGTVTYVGALGVAEPFGGAVVGDLEVGVRFADSTLSGTVDNFIDNFNESYSGSLAITNGSIDRTTDLNTQYTFVADVDGVLYANGSSTLVNALMLGDFTGASQEGMIGILSGSATTPGIGTLALDSSNTAFAAKR